MHLVAAPPAGREGVAAAFSPLLCGEEIPEGDKHARHVVPGSDNRLAIVWRILSADFRGRIKIALRDHSPRVKRNWSTLVNEDPDYFWLKFNLSIVTI